MKHGSHKLQATQAGESPQPVLVHLFFRRLVMWRPDESFIKKYHIAGSIATLVLGISIICICLAPAHFPGVYKLLVDDRIGIVIPYLLFIALGESIFSIWYFLFRK